MKNRGFTLVELMIAIAVVAILLVLATPSFTEFRERQSLRGAADNFIFALGQAKEEAIKRDDWVRVDFRQMGTGVCMGAVVVATPATAGCDCSSEACAVAKFPEVVGDLKNVTLSGGIAFGAAGNGFVIDPKTGTLADIATTGGFNLTTASGYTVRINVNAMARPQVCTPAGATKSLSGVPSC